MDTAESESLVAVAGFVDCKLKSAGMLPDSVEEWGDKHREVAGMVGMEDDYNHPKEGEMAGDVVHHQFADWDILGADQAADWDTLAMDQESGWDMLVVDQHADWDMIVVDHRVD